MNLLGKSINELAESKTEIYKSKVKELESLNDMLNNEKKDEYHNKLSKEEQTKLNNQNMYFKDFLTGNLNKMIHNQRKSTRQRKNSFINIDEFKSLKNRASILGKRNEVKFFSPKAKANFAHTGNYEKLGYIDTSLDKVGLGIQNNFRRTMGTPKNNFLLQNKPLLNTNSNFENFTNLNNLNIDNYHQNKIFINNHSKHKNNINKSFENEKNGQLFKNKEFRIITEEKTFDANVIGKANTLGSFNTPALHPKLSLRVHQFLNDLQKRTKRFSKEEFENSLYQKTENNSNDFLGNTKKLDNTNINFSMNNEIKLDFNNNYYNNSNFSPHLNNMSINHNNNKNQIESTLRNLNCKKIKIDKYGIKKSYNQKENEYNDTVSMKINTLRNAKNKKLNLKNFYGVERLKNEDDFAYESSYVKSSERRKYNEVKSYPKANENINLTKFLDSQRKNKAHTNRSNSKENKNPINYINFDIDKKIDCEFTSPDKMKKVYTKGSKKDSDSDAIFRVATKKLSQKFKKIEYQNLLDYSQSNNRILLKDDLYNNLINKNDIEDDFIEFENNEKSKPEKQIEMKIIITEEDNKTQKLINFRSNSFKKVEKQSPIVTKDIKEFESQVINRTNSMKLSPKNKPTKKFSSSFKLSNEIKLVKPHNFFENFEHEIEKHKKELYKFNSGKLFCNLDKDQILDKLHRKQFKINEIERKRELSRKKVNFNLSDSNLKQCNSLDLSSIKRYNSNTSRFNINANVEKNSDIKIYDASKVNYNESSEIKEDTDDNNREKFRFLAKRDQVEDSLSDEEDFEILNNNYDGGCLIETDSFFRKFWDFIITLITLYTLIISPFRLAFNDLDFDLVNYFEMCMDCIFILDIVMQFFIPYYNAEEDLIKNKYLIAKNYLSGWFVLDVIASIPGSIITNFLDSYNEMSNSLTEANSISKINKVTRITKLYKILKFTKLSKIIKLSTLKNKQTNQSHIPSLEDLNISSSIIRMVNFFLVFILVTHIITCVWIFIGNSTYPSWILRHGLIDAQTGELYVSSLYFHWTTIFTIGYGDIISTNSVERLYNCILMFVGILIYSFAVSSLGTLVSSYDGITLKFMKNMEQLQEISRRYNVPEKFNEKVYKYLRYDYKFNKSEKFAFINELPMRLKNTLLINMYREVIRNFKFLKDNSPEFTSKVVFMMKPLRMNLKEYIITEGEFLEEVIFVRRGHLTIHLGKNYNEHKLMEIRKNEHFGDILVLSNLRSPVTIKVGSKLCDLLIIKKQDLLEIAADYPESIEEIFLVSSFNYSSLIELIEAKKRKLDNENEKLKSRKLEFLNYLKSKQSNNQNLIENLNVIAENKRVVDNINRRIESENQREKEFEDSLMQNNINFEKNLLNAINSLKDGKDCNFNEDCSSNKLNSFYLGRLDIKSNSEKNVVSFGKSFIGNQITRIGEENSNLLELGLKPKIKNSLSDAVRSSRNFSQSNFRKIFEFGSDDLNYNKNVNINVNRSKEQIANNYLGDDNYLILSENKSSKETIVHNSNCNLNYKQLKKNEKFAFIYNKLKSDNELNDTFTNDYSFDNPNNIKIESKIVNYKNSNEDILKETNFTNNKEVKNLHNINNQENSIDKNKSREINSNLLEKNCEKQLNIYNSFDIPEEDLFEKDKDIANLQNASTPLKCTGFKKLFKNNLYNLDQEKIIEEEREDINYNFLNEKINDDSIEKFSENYKNILPKSQKYQSERDLDNYLDSAKELSMIIKKELEEEDNQKKSDMKNNSKDKNSLFVNQKTDKISENKLSQLNMITNLKKNIHQSDQIEHQNKNISEYYYKLPSENEIKDKNLALNEIYSKPKSSNYSSLSNIFLDSVRDKLKDNNKRENLIFKESTEKLISEFKIESKESNSSAINILNENSKEMKNLVSNDSVTSICKPLNNINSDSEKKLQTSKFYKSNPNKLYIKEASDIKNQSFKRSKTITSKSLEPIQKLINIKKNDNEIESKLNDSSSFDNSREVKKQKTFILTNNNNNIINISIKCDNCDHVITIDKDLILRLQKGNIDNINFDCRDNGNAKDLTTDCNKIISSKKEVKNEKNIKNIYNIYNNCNINQTIETGKRTSSKENNRSDKNKHSNEKNNQLFLNNQDYKELKSLSNKNDNKINLNTGKEISKFVQIDYVENSSKRKNENSIYKAEKEFNLQNEQWIQGNRKSLSEEFRNEKIVICKSYNNKNSKSPNNNIMTDCFLTEKLNTTYNIASEDNINSQGKKHSKNENIKNLIDCNIARFKKSRNNNNNLLTTNSPTASASSNKKQLPIKKNKIKENLKNMRNRLRFKDSSKFRKSTEIVHDIYNSIFFRNKVLNNPDEFYFNEFKSLFRTGLQEEVKKESVKINNIISKILKLSRFAENFSYDDKNNFVELKKINAKTSEDLDFKIDIPFMDVDKQ